MCICVFYIWYTGMSYLISLNPMLLKNIAHVGSFKHFVFVYLRIYVFMYLCICVLNIWYMGMSYLISLNLMLFKNIANVGSFKHFLFVYLCICVFVYFTFDTRAYHIWYTGISYLISWNPMLFKNMVGSFKHWRICKISKSGCRLRAFM